MPVGRSSGLQYAIGDGYSALDAEAARNRLDGYAVVDGLGVTVSSGLTLSIASGTATVGSTSGTVDTVSLGSSTTTTLSSADSTHPRKDTVYIDTGGTVQVEQGTAEAAAPGGNDRFDTFEPEPPLPSTEGVILAEVWVAAGASSLSASDVRDRRQPAHAVVDEVDAREVTTEDATVTNSLTGTDLALSDDDQDPTTELTYDGTTTLASYKVAGQVDGDNNAVRLLNLNAVKSVISTASITAIGATDDKSKSFIDELRVLNRSSLTVKTQDSDGVVSRSWSYGTNTANSIDLSIDDTTETYHVGLIITGGIPT